MHAVQTIFKDVYKRQLKQNVNKMKQTLGTLSKDDMTKLVAAVEQGEEVSVPGWDDKFAADIFSVQTKTKEGISPTFSDGPP